jgi:regulator of replication initiation timing
MPMSVEEMQREAREIFETYDAEFAGQPRASRDLELLDDLIERLEGLLERARTKLNGGENDALVSVIEQGSENLEIYRTERRAVLEVREGGEGPLRASRLATWANAEFHRYRRHFAGEGRPTRDLELLNEMMTELSEIRDGMEELLEETDVEGLEEDLATVEDNLEMYREERERIAEARQDGTLEERASYLAAAANEQFAVYSDLFAGKDRVTRRPKLLRRVIRNLEQIGRRMEELDEEGAPGPQNEQNLGIVEDNLEMYRDELEAVGEARERVDPERLAGRLGSAANQVFETYRDEYAERDRTTRDLEQLGRMCDELYHLARQMEGIREKHGLEMNEENLSVVLENLSLYQSEYDAIADTQEGVG